MRDSFIFYRSFYECVADLPDETRLAVYEAVFQFALDGKEPNIDGVPWALFKAFEPQIVANNRKYDNGCKGGRPNKKPNNNQSITKPKPNKNQTITKAKPNHNQTITKAEPNDNDNDNDNVNDNGNGNVSGFGERNSDVVPSLLSFLNSETGGSYTETEQFDDLVSNLLEQGYTEEDIRTVIRKKSAEWSCDGKMRSLLRPSVLLGDKFEEYLNAPEPLQVEEQETRTKKDKQLRKDLDEKTDELDSVNGKIKLIRGAINDDANYDTLENFDELNELKLRAGILEQEIESIKYRLGGAT